VISDDQLAAEAPEDVSVVLAWDMVDRVDAHARRNGFPPLDAKLRGVSEVIFRISEQHPEATDRLIGQLQHMIDFTRKTAR
jgi:hypothetical protein